MFRHSNEYRSENREKMRGGNGSVRIEHLWEPGKEMLSANRMFGRLTLEPGCSIGFHNHDEEEEVFYVVRGEAEADDNGKTVRLSAGDTLLTGNGAGHSISNCGSDTLELIAVISQYGK